MNGLGFLGFSGNALGSVTCYLGTHDEYVSGSQCLPFAVVVFFLLSFKKKGQKLHS